MTDMINLINLNGANGADKILLDVCRKLAETVKDHRLYGAELGIAYGGGVQQIGRMWKPVGGTIYGLDTFCGHPKQLAITPDSHEAICMDGWYGHFGTEALSVEYQQAALDAEGLDNVKLRPGLIADGCLDDVPWLDYCLLDMDLIASMALGWRIVGRKMIAGGYLCLHDVVPRGHLLGLWGLYQEIMASGEYELVGESPQSYLAVLRRKAA